MFNPGEIVKVEVKDKSKRFYTPDYLHSNIGYVFQIDDEHIYIKAFRKDIHGKSYVSSCDRYVLNDVIIEEINMEY